MNAVAQRVVFDRLNPEPPKSLGVLRNRGHWRWWKTLHGKGVTYTPAMFNATCYGLPEHRGLMVDAGCGHSDDARIAVCCMRFEKAIKVDLWDPYPDCSYFQTLLCDYEGMDVKFVRGDICKLTDYLQPESVDFINCNAMIDLLSADDRRMFYNEAFDVLRDGGILSVAHIPLAMGHQDWVSGHHEFERLSADGYAAFERLLCRKSAMVLRRICP